MNNLTPSRPTWQERCDRLAIKVPTVSRVTGFSERSIRAYRDGSRTPPATFLDKVDELLTSVELAVADGGTAA